ncbi:MAG: ribosome maturation factor rimM [Candidatus Thiodiazotropha taylori]|uniref:Ribosome maturation factor rimM n=1 Tax=Candidatus Thiodiazotropha taylori TaxID=2792791 RepID=A0A9E4P3N7_9GAMM|nr:ribosome maturation factor rimM [Candidatus Thiodiazotropha taylori]MCG8026444.1 ribosome maturation factor rimM [Candidatus Thiodiazotropha taylori]MCG8050389.1 ribosome maturation factor rimM [Candidatus Thiodiazotropha taylori]MCG8106665.1 ribosome maturation factor rimM [Candidatus Thiodiazotropha taylori]MCG8110837.1 ribosome maturation factor rimM [Candidatus Thiodiazotropha taylori]
MINPVNSDKTVQTTTDKSGQSHASSKTEQPRGSAVEQAQAAVEQRPTLDVDNARHLYQMETTRSGQSDPISTPQQARSMLDSLLQQISSSPESAAQAQLAQVSKPLVNLLESAPA